MSEMWLSMQENDPRPNSNHSYGRSGEDFLLPSYIEKNIEITTLLFFTLFFVSLFLYLLIRSFGASKASMLMKKDLMFP